MENTKSTTSYHFDYAKATKDFQNKQYDENHIEQPASVQDVAHFIMTAGSPVERCDELIATDLSNCELKLTVNGVELDIIRVLERLSSMLTV